MASKETGKDIPRITEAQLELTRKRILSATRNPLFPAGTVTTCPVCKGEMVTTNNLTRAIATPMALVVLTRLPGAECVRCGAREYDPAALAITMEHSGSEIVADYETKVTRASGRTLGTYFKADLSRVLKLSGKERLRWKVLGQDKALVEVER